MDTGSSVNDSVTIADDGLSVCLSEFTVPLVGGDSGCPLISLVLEQDNKNTSGDDRRIPLPVQIFTDPSTTNHCKKRMEAFRKRIAELEMQLLERNEQLQSLQSEKRELGEKVHQLRAERNEWRAECRKWRVECGKLQAMEPYLDAMRAECGELQAECGELRAECGKLRKEYWEVQDELSEAKKKLFEKEALEEMQANPDMYSEYLQGGGAKSMKLQALFGKDSKERSDGNDAKHTEPFKADESSIHRSYSDEDLSEIIQLVKDVLSAPGDDNQIKKKILSTFLKDLLKRLNPSVEEKCDFPDIRQASTDSTERYRKEIEEKHIMAFDAMFGTVTDHIPGARLVLCMGKAACGLMPYFLSPEDTELQGSATESRKEDSSETVTSSVVLNPNDRHYFPMQSPGNIS